MSDFDFIQYQEVIKLAWKLKTHNVYAYVFDMAFGSNQRNRFLKIQKQR